VKYYRKC